MPYTRRQVRFLLSSGSPFSNEKKSEVKQELHQNPSLGHARKGSAEMKRKSSRMAQIFKERK